MSQKESIKSKIDKLKAQVEWFYGEEFDLGKAAEQYKKAVRLAGEIEQDLAELKNEIKIIDEDFSK